MIETLNTFSSQLKETCKLTGSKWAAWLKRDGQQWDLLTGISLRKAQREALLGYLQQPKTSAWLAGALSSGRVRFRSPGAGSALAVERVYAFPNPQEPLILLVGAEKLDPAAQGYFRVLAREPEPGAPRRQPARPPRAPGELDPEALYHPDQLLDRVLESLIELQPCDGATLAVRWGNSFRIERIWNCSSRALGMDVVISSANALDSLVRMRRGMIFSGDDGDPVLQRITDAVGFTVRSCLRAPFVMGRRVIAVVAFLSARRDGFSQKDIERLEGVMSRLTPVVESAILFQEATRYLQRFALLNDIASAASLRIGAEEIAQTVIRRLQAVFQSEHISLLLRSQGEKKIFEYSSAAAEPYSLPAGIGLAARVVESGQPLRIGNRSDLPDGQPLLPGIHSVLVVPLKYQGEVIGIIALESEKHNAFTEADQQLLVMIASQLAGVFENARLNQEMQERLKELQERSEAQRLAENQLIRSARLAAVGEMAAGMAHELNNPLTSIIGFVELAVDAVPPESALRADLELVLKEAQRARGVLRNLLDFTRQSEKVRQPAQINDLILDSLALVQHHLDHSCIKVKVDLAPDLPPVYVDPDQIKQVLLNLIHNSVQAMPDGGSLFIETRPSTDPEHHRKEGLVFTVRDTGEGVSAENQQRLFEPFFTTRPVGEGTGLGLAVSYGIVTAHQGLINVESEVGQGACFTIWLPRMEPDEHE